LTSSHLQRASFSGFDPGSPELVRILTYPRFDEADYSARLAELRGMGVTSIILGGDTVVHGTKIAGKGCVGLVVRAKAGRKTCALKIRRVDANRESMAGEARLHRIANDADVGPRLYDHSQNFMLMEFAEGASIADWAVNAAREQARTAARDVLEQCFLLDRAGLDHGQLSRLDRHVIVGKRPVIIDFETASTERRVVNVSSAGQSLFVAGAVASAMGRAIGRTDKDAAISALRAYKRDQTRRGLKALIAALDL
jgi:putative serine/threonine protein kinase